MNKQWVESILACGLAILALLAQASADEPSRWSGASNEVRCTEIAFSQTAETRDAVAFERFLDEDTRFVGASVLRGPKAVTKAWAPFFAEGGPQLVWRPFVVEVAASGDIALSRGPYRMRALDGDGELVESWGVYNSVWRKSSDGTWKIIFDAGNAGENQVDETLKALIETPVENCGPTD
jgi:ketosteroid isomerase-like protein